LRRLRHLLLSDQDRRELHLTTCAETACRASGAMTIVQAVQGYLLQHGLVDRIALHATGCHGFCEMGPTLLVEPQQAFYPKVKVEHVPEIIEAALEGRYVEHLLYRDSHTGRICYQRDDIPFFKHQQRTVLGMSQKIEAERIHDYIVHGGYAALAQALDQGDPAWVVEEVKRSGLRGRGGGGFPTGLKWEMLARQPGDRGKFLVCNADEGDPGAYMDRSILEGNPHSVLEGMLLGAYATGATEGIVYVRSEYPLASQHLSVALRQAREFGLLGQGILGTDFHFDVQMIRGAGAFVCGEETALIHSVEGKMGEPRQRPPFPIEKGIDGKPTAINNVETWANIPVIINQGAEQFAAIGTKNNSGTKVFSLVGKIKNTGLVEVPMGMTIGQIVHDIGGGPVGKAKIKAVQTGGPSGGCIPASQFHLPIDYDTLAAAGSIMGSGGMIVMDESTCMVDVAKYFMNFLRDESCGKCFTCRKGTQRMYEILDDITRGLGTPEHIDLLEELALVVKDTTMCGLGQTAANPVLSTLRHFRHEYQRHVIDKRCDAFVCRELVGASCQAACPLETEAWRYVALVEKGRYEEAYQVIREANPLPSICARVCDRQCEQHCQLGAMGADPVAIRALKRFVTDRVDPSVYRQKRVEGGAGPICAQHPKGRSGKSDLSSSPGPPSIAVIGAGPAGLTAAHDLAGLGYRVTLFDAEAEPGGMLLGCIPAYRLPREVLRKEIQSLLTENITLRCGTVLGRDVTLDGLFAEGFRAVFLAIGADKSWRLDLPGEELAGVCSSMEFLKAFNLHGEELAGGNVGIIGGGNSAVDAARVAMRQRHVQSVRLLYRRTSRDMPAFAEEVEAALEEGIELETLVSPVKIRYIEAALREGVKVETMVSPVRIHARDGRLVGIECVRNRLGDMDASGRRRPVAIPGSEFTLSLNTLIVAIGERPDSEPLKTMGLEIDKAGSVVVDPDTLATGREGVFAGGDLVTGPNTVVGAMAAGRRAAQSIDRYLQGLPLRRPPEVHLPSVFVEPAAVEPDEDEAPVRIDPATIPAPSRQKSFVEVELSLSAEQAAAEARRCLRCDLKFTSPASGRAVCPAAEN
jgi:NADH-quinone oxidoreductase subunit F